MPRFSVCIPTRERHETLKSAIETVLAQTFSDFELVIQDNFSSPTTAEVVRSFDDPRIVYARSDRRLAMHENWELAISRTRGDYIVIIGDDDAMMPDCLDRANEMGMNERPDVMFSMGHLYYWPDVPDVERRNYLRLDYRGHFEWREAFLDKPHAKSTSDYPRRTPGTAFLDHEAMLQNILTWSNSRLYVSVYHGFVSRALVDRVKAANGGIYFVDPTPDFASMVVNLYYATSVLFSAKPFTMTGQSGKSNGGNAGSARDLQKAADRFVAESGVSFERLLPTVFPPYVCPFTVVAGCYEAVKQKSFPHDDRFKIDWKRCLTAAASETMQQPAEDRDAYRRWVLASADRLGMDPAELIFSAGAADEAERGVKSDRPTSAWKRLRGVEADRLGRVHYIHVDGDRFNLKTIVDAVAVAHSFSPINTFDMDILPSLTAEPPVAEEPSLAPEPLGAEEQLLTPMVETKASASQSNMVPAHTTDWVLFMRRIRRNLSEAWKRTHNI